MPPPPNPPPLVVLVMVTAVLSPLEVLVKILMDCLVSLPLAPPPVLTPLPPLPPPLVVVMVREVDLGQVIVTMTSRVPVVDPPAPLMVLLVLLAAVTPLTDLEPIEVEVKEKLMIAAVLILVPVPSSPLVQKVFTLLGLLTVL